MPRFPGAETRYRPTLKELKAWLVDEAGFKFKSLKYEPSDSQFTIHIEIYVRGERETRRDRMRHEIKDRIVGILYEHGVYINNVPTCYVSAGNGFLTLKGYFEDDTEY